MVCLPVLERESAGTKNGGEPRACDKGVVKLLEVFGGKGSTGCLPDFSVGDSLFEVGCLEGVGEEHFSLSAKVDGLWSVEGGCIVDKSRSFAIYVRSYYIVFCV